jgi:archaellum biogenesis protein FlaJ (TadC family)
MSERAFRFIQGIYLLIALFFEIDMMIYVFIGVFLFEALTNWRVPIIVSRLRYGADALKAQRESQKTPRFSFEAERMLRITVVALLVISFILYPELLWFLPWFVAVMLLLAGITKICPMVLFYRYFGFR